MQVSVIIPFHLGDVFLQDCLNSLKAQVYRDFEVLLILDSYPGDIEPLLAPYLNDMDIKVLHLSGKTGVAAARNLGLDHAKGNYVYFLDSDDYIYEEALARMVAKAQRVPYADPLSDQNAEDLDPDSDHGYANPKEDEESVPAQVVYGKKYSTWYRRDVYVPIFTEQLEQRRLEREAEEGQDPEGGTAEDGTAEDENPEEAENDEEAAVNLDPDELEKIENELLDKGRRKAFRYIFGKKRRIKNVSVLHILIDRAFLEEHHLRFPENIKYYSDLPFLLQLLDKATYFARIRAAKYFKRKHGDPINLPALSQIRDKDRFFELIDTYFYAAKLVEPDSYARNRLDLKIIYYYTDFFAPKLRRSDKAVWKTERFDAMVKVANNILPETVNSLHRYRKKLIMRLQKGDLKHSLSQINRHMAYKKLKRIFRKKHEIGKYFYRNHFLKQPVLKNYIMLESFFAKGYSDSPKYIYEYLNKNYPGRFRYVWSMDSKTKLPYGGIKVKRFSVRYMKYLARSQYFIFNVRQPVWFKKREGTTFLQTWHGTPLKRLAFDIEEVFGASPQYKKDIYIQSRKWDYLVAANEFSSKIFRQCFLYDNEMLEFGYPRNDILHSDKRDETAASIRQKLNIPLDKKTILYAPTWRDDECYGKGAYRFTLKLDLHMMKQRLLDGYAVLLRTHYFIADQIDVTGLEGFVINVSRYDDISELYLISDIIITDYSSVFFDYAGLKRPMLFFTYDLDKYRDILHGFYMDMEKELPGPLLFTSEEVIDAIQNIDEITKKYKNKYEVFYHKYCSWEDGHAAENIANRVFGLK